jgi:hypothetical protein
MRNLILLFIGASTAFMAYLFLQPVCAGGSIVRDEAQCRITAGFDAAFCRDAFMKTPAIARVSGPSYAQRGDCDVNWPVCVDHASGWGPKPVAWCLARDGAAMAKRIEPQYDRRG